MKKIAFALIAFPTLFSQNVMATQPQVKATPQALDQLTLCRQAWDKARQSKDTKDYEDCLTACASKYNTRKQDASVLGAYHLHCRTLKKLTLSKSHE